jgi:hypothetical protein
MDAGNPQAEGRARPLTSQLKRCMVTNLEENETFIKVILFNTWNENKAAGVHFHLRHLYGDNEFPVRARYSGASIIRTAVTRIFQWSDNFGPIRSHYFPLKSLKKVHYYYHYSLFL